MSYWLLFAVLYPFLYAIVNVIDKFLIEKKIRNYYSYSFVTGLLFMISAIIVWAIVGLPLLPKSIIFFAVLSGVVYGLVYYVYFYLLTKIEVSRIIGMVYLFAAFVAVYSRIFLGEQLSVLKYIAIGVAIIGTALIGAHRHGKKIFIIHKFLWIMVLYAAILGIVDVCDKFVLNHVTNWEGYVVLTVPLALTLMLPVFSAKVRKDLPQTIKYWPLIFFVQSIAILGLFAFFKAVSMQKIAIISAMGTLQPVFLFMIMLALSIFVPKILKEVLEPKIIIYKAIGILLVVAAAIILGT